MFSTMLTVALQVLVLFSLMFLGIFLSKKKILTDTGSSQLTDILLLIVTPCVIINAFFSTPFDTKKLNGLLMTVLIAVLTHVIAILISILIFKKNPDKIKTVMQLGAIFSNAGYMGIPLMLAVVGTEGALYSSVYIAVFNVFLWTAGVILCVGKKNKISLKKIFINPGTVAIMIGLPVFLLSANQSFMQNSVLIYLEKNVFTVPKTAVSMLASLNTPLAMLVIGFHMSKIDFKSIWNDQKIYLVSGFRLIVVPLLMFYPIYLFCNNSVLAISCIISVSAPCATVTSLFAEKYEKDVVFASKCVTFSTLFSIITMPVFVALMSAVKSV